MKNSCTEIRSSLKEYLGNKLEPEKQKQVELHLNECADCQAELEQEKELLALFENAPSQVCPRELVENLKAIPGDNSIALPVRKVSKWQYAGVKIAAAVAVAALLLIVCWPTTPVPEQIADRSDLDQQQIAGELRWSLALTANFLLEARELVEKNYSEARLSEIINSAVAKGAESPFLNLRSQRNGG